MNKPNVYRIKTLRGNIITLKTKRLGVTFKVNYPATNKDRRHIFFMRILFTNEHVCLFILHMISNRFTSLKRCIH